MMRCSVGLRWPYGVARRRAILAMSAAACTGVLPGLAFAKNEGVTDTEILLGQSCQLSGPLAALTTEVRLGAKLHFDEVNRNGGINGRQVRVIALDDAYDPKRSAENTIKLIDEENVLALFQYAGTPGSLAAVPIAEEKRVPLFAPFTGSDALRTKHSRYVFNIKAGYGDELEAMVKQIGSIGINKAAVVYLNNGFGTGGLAQVEKSAASHRVQLLSKAALEADGSKMDATVAATAQHQPPAIIIISAGKSSVDFIDAYLKAGHRSTFYMLSVTSNTQLVQVLGPRARGIVISQVVPSPWNLSIKLVREFQTLARAARLENLTFSQMEGFVAANIMTDALKRAGKIPTRDGLIRALEETRRLDLGGYLVELSPTRHSSGKLVDLLILDSQGKFRK
ncbi:MAG TPA: ABC transporter substrate-binding protein [Ramlibacter sp.]|nr:ABC transporter substrate-binding protein [Ramlibacter sp.]